MATDLQQFQALVGQLMSPQNDIRNQAESEYNKLNDPEKIQFLLQVITPTSDKQIAGMAAVLLRRLLTTIDTNIGTAPEQLLSMCKAHLVQTVQQETEPQLRKKICDAIAELSKCYIDDDGNNQWPEILQFLIECGNGGAEMQEVGLNIFCAFPGIFGTSQDKHLQVIKTMLLVCMQEDKSSKVRVLAGKAATSFVTEALEESHYRLFTEMIPWVLQVIDVSLKSEDDDVVLKNFVELIENAPKLIKPHLNDTLTLMLQIVSNSEYENSWRHLALEAIVTISETAPALIRKFANPMIPKIIPEMLALMVDLEEDPNWSTTDDYDDADEDSNPVAGESSLDRFACGIGGKTVLPHIIATIPPMLQHEDWRYRHAALMAISAVAEGCKKQMEPLLGNVVDSILPFLMDPHPRVRYASCNALGQLASDFAVTFQKKFHEKVLPGLLHVMVNNNEHPRVQAHAAAAIVNFCEDCPIEVLEPYLDTVVEKLELVLTAKMQELLQKGTKLVMEQIITTIATVADTAEQKFVVYYDKFMPSLKYIFQNATTKDYRLLRGKTIECISLIGLAVGAEKFLPDASEVMQLLLKTQTDTADIEADDPQISYLISAWARMCKIIGKDFVQYLPVVMPPVLKAAQIKPEVALLNVDDPDNQDIDNDEGWEFVELGEQQKFGIKTAGLEDKSTACQMLVHYARELKEGFAEYTEQVVKIMVPLLKFYFHDTVRVTAAESLPHLLECAKIKGDDYLQQMWAFVAPELLQAIEGEPEEAVIPEMMDSFAKCIEKLGVGCISNELLTQLGQLFHEKLAKHSERHDERHAKRTEDDYDEEVEETLQDEHDTDEYILSKMSDIMHTLFKTHREAILPFFEQLLPDFTSLLKRVGPTTHFLSCLYSYLLHMEMAEDTREVLKALMSSAISRVVNMNTNTAKHADPRKPASDRQWSLCIFDDLMEYTGPASVKYQEFFLKHLLSFVVDRSPEVRQAAAYGCGVMAQFGGKDYASACAQAVPLLAQVINQPNSRVGECINPTENCISAITKICKYNSEGINVNELIPTWVSWLPIIEDQEEAPHVYGYLCDLVELNHPGVLGANNEYVPRVIAILAEAMAAEVFKSCPEIATRVNNILRFIQSNSEVWNACLARLTERQRQAILEPLTNGQ